MSAGAAPRPSAISAGRALARPERSRKPSASSISTVERALICPLALPGARPGSRSTNGSPSAVLKPTCAEASGCSVGAWELAEGHERAAAAHGDARHRPDLDAVDEHVGVAGQALRVGEPGPDLAHVRARQRDGAEPHEHHRQQRQRHGHKRRQQHRVAPGEVEAHRTEPGRPGTRYRTRQATGLSCRHVSVSAFAALTASAAFCAPVAPG